MKVKSSDKDKCGIYLIRNLLTGKLYIGKSINIYKRIKAHIWSLDNKRIKEENPHFIASWHKYGKENFMYCIIEECLYECLKERERYWILYYDSLNSKIGYNKRLDSEGGMIPHAETKRKLTESMKKRYSTQEARDKQGVKTSLFWKDNPIIKTQMALKVKEKKQIYNFIQMLEDESIVKVYSTIEDIINENPTYKWQNIYAVCNGYKKRIYGYKWKKELKI